MEFEHSAAASQASLGGLHAKPDNGDPMHRHSGEHPLRRSQGEGDRARMARESGAQGPQKWRKRPTVRPLPWLSLGRNAGRKGQTVPRKSVHQDRKSGLWRHQTAWQRCAPGSIQPAKRGGLPAWQVV